MIDTFKVGFIFGILLTLGLTALPDTSTSKYKNAIKECEKGLSKTEHCRIVAVLDYKN